MAKDILERYITLTLNSQSLGGDIVPGTLSVSRSAAEVSMTGVSNTVENFLTDRDDYAVAFQAHMNNTATTGAWTVINALVNGTEYTMTINFGTGGAPASGDPSYTGSHVITKRDVTQSSGRLVIDCAFKPGPTADVQWTTV